MKRATPEVLAAIEDLYRVFAKYPLPAWTDPCTHCHSEDEEKQLHAAPLRELGTSELRPYAVDALLVWGDEAIFKHFLPRIFELYMIVEQPALQLDDPEMLFKKFRYGKWHLWPAEEQAAVRKFLHAVWHAFLSDPPDQRDAPYDMDCWICAIAQAEDDLGPYLREWIVDQSPAACLALSALLTQGLENPFWEDRDAPREQLNEWLRSNEVRDKLSRARATATSPELEAEFDAALETFEPR
jgi:hypothetical protein